MRHGKGPEERAMTEPALEPLEAHIDRLEREARRTRKAMRLALVGAVAVVLMGQATPHRPPKSLEAEEFVLRDSRGQVRAMLGTAQNSGATVLQIHGENGKPRTRITVSSDGTSSFEVLDSGEHVRVLLGVRDNGAPRLWLGNETGKIIWRAP
jgi:hypothetical protein